MRMEQFILVNGKKTCVGVVENKFGKTGQCIAGFERIIWQMGAAD